MNHYTNVWILIIALAIESDKIVERPVIIINVGLNGSYKKYKRIRYIYISEYSNVKNV